MNIYEQQFRTSLQRIQPGDASFERLEAIAKTIAEGAHLLGLPIYALPPFKTMVFFEHNEKLIPFFKTQHVLNSATSVALADAKFATSRMLKAHGIPVVNSQLYSTEEDFIHAVLSQNIPTPCVIKPYALTVKGNGVLTNISDPKEILHHGQQLFERHRKIIVEKFYSFAKEFRILVLDDEVIGVVERVPAYVVGDGRLTIEELIQAKNVQRSQNGDPAIRVDAELEARLQESEYTLNSVLEDGQHFQLKNVCNYGAGGEIIVRDNSIHPSIAEMAVAATKALGLRIAGLDLLCDDAGAPLSEDSGVFIEINANPDIAMHGYHHPEVALNIAKKIVQATIKEK